MSPPSDDTTFQAELAAFTAQPTTTRALVLAGGGDERALPALVAAMNDAMEGQDIVAYRQAVRMLATPGLLQRWLDNDLAARRVAAHALTAHDPEHAPLIAKALADPDDQVRAISRRTLRAWTASPPLHQLMRNAIGHDDPRVRALAAEALGKLRSTADLDLLRGALDRESDDHARGRVAWALECIESLSADA